MYFSANIVIFLVICNYGIVRGQDVPCPVAADIDPCKCYPFSRQIRCEGANVLKIPDALTKLTGNWKVLYIHDTKIPSLAANTFEHAQFYEIFISENNVLTTIDQLAFGPLTQPKITTVLEIRKNTILKESGLFEIAKSCAATVATIGFDENNFEKFDGMKFHNNFIKLESLNLNSQKNQKVLNLPADFISSPPLLHQLSLDFNRISAIADTSIVLTETNPARKRISIFLNDNTLSADITNIKLPKPESKVAVGLDIERNKIGELNALNVKLLEDIAKSGVSPNFGNVYLADNPIIKCDCTSAKPLRKTEIWERFQGLINVDCGTNVGKLALCPAPPPSIA